jgi:hypothetical protein
VKLAKAEMPTKKFGRVPRPHFEIVGWDDLVGDPPANEFGDSIPF